GAEARQPPVAQASHPAELRRRPPSEPDVERLLAGLGQHAQALVAEAVAVVVDAVLGPDTAEKREGFVEPRRPLPARHAEGLLLVRLHGAEAEGRQEPPSREAI